MDNRTKKLEAIRDGHPQVSVFIASTGAGAKLQGTCWDIPGASSFLAGACFPYSKNELNAFLGFEPEQYCSRETAIEMAMASYIRAYENLVEHGKLLNKEPVGVGLTASVATLQPHRGDHRVYCAAMTRQGVFVTEYVLPKGDASVRERDGNICDQIGLGMLYHACKIPTEPIRVFINDEQRWNNFMFQPIIENVLDAELRTMFFKHPVFTSYGTRFSAESIDPSETVFLPGSFNPLHDGHRHIATEAEVVTNKHVMYMTTIDSVHKASLTMAQILERASQVRNERWKWWRRSMKLGRSILFTQQDPLFIDKAERYPGVGFVVGADTVQRMLEPQWYPDGANDIVKMLERFIDLGTCFYVCGRTDVEGKFQTIRDLELPKLPGLTFLFRHIPVDIQFETSSTEIRKKGLVVT